MIDVAVARWFIGKNVELTTGGVLIATGPASPLRNCPACKKYFVLVELTSKSMHRIPDPKKTNS
jgi:hypothetical protein